ncbi:MAG: YqaA family protein [Gammaproteobacteria bacterium]|nr:YqaA family protein [Gammaproteobacteria bacterium]
MRMFGALYDRVIGWSAHPRAPWFLGGLSFAESSFFPIPPDVLLAPMCVARPSAWWRLALLTTLASVVGGLFGYLLGALFLDLLTPWIEQMGYAPAMDKARIWFSEWGFWAMFLAGFSPIPYKAFTLTAGALGMPLIPFVLASLCGRGGRFFLVAWLMSRFGAAFEARLRPFMEWLGWGLVAVVGLAYVLMT